MVVRSQRSASIKHSPTGTVRYNCCRSLSGDGVECACRDDYKVGCQCKDSTIPEYYSCSGSSAVFGKPYTRSRHCNPGGKCDGVSICVKPGAVWEPGKVGTSSVTACRTDDNCKSHPGNLTQCGFRLFNLEDWNSGKKVKLDKKVKPNKRKRRGFCSGEEKKSCSNKPTPNPLGTGSPQIFLQTCLPSQGECRGYMLETF